VCIGKLGRTTILAAPGMGVTAAAAVAVTDIGLNYISEKIPQRYTNTHILLLLSHTSMKKITSRAKKLGIFN